MGTPTSYFVVMRQFGPDDYEAVVDPKRKWCDIVRSLRIGEYPDLAYVHWVLDGVAKDVTDETRRVVAMWKAMEGDY